MLGFERSALAICLGLLTTPALAQEGIRDSDVMLSKEELTEYLSGHVLEFYTNGLATYASGGAYSYQYEPDGDAARGRYMITSDGQVCTDFLNGFARCDYIVKSGERFVMVIENGERYPVRARRTLYP